MSLREAFLLDPEIVFLNHGSFGACPASVFEEYQLWQRKLEHNPVEFLGRRSGVLLQQALEQLARYLGSDPVNMVFMTNATTAVNTVLRSLVLEPGDEIITTDHEYGACDNVLRHVSKQTGAKIVFCQLPLPYPGDEKTVDLLWAHVSSRTRLIFLSHITSTTALILPVDEICRRARRADILTFVDGAHIPGHRPLQLDGLGADFYTGNCHKWLCAPKGAAFLYVRPERQQCLDATVISWGYSSHLAGHSGFDAYTGITPLSRRHQWQGTRDIAAFLSVPAAIEFQENHDWDSVRQRCHELAWATHQALTDHFGLQGIAPHAQFGQMIPIPVPACDAEDLRRRLFGEFRIEVPVTSHDGRNFVRISVQGYNSQSDLDALQTALKRVF